MSTIYSDSFHNGKGHTDGDDVPLALAFQHVADDLNSLQVAAIVSPDATDLPTAQTLVNEIKASLNVVAAITPTTINGGTR